jgi:phage tail-like protein
MLTDVGELIVRLDGSVLRTLPLGGPVLSIGRTPDNGLSLPHPTVSGRHAELRLTTDGVVLTDTGSLNGTFVEGVRVPAHQPLRLSAGSAFRIGPFVLSLRLNEQDQAVESVQLEAQPVEEADGRPVYAAPEPPGEASSYLDFLPLIFQDGPFLGRFLLLFESMWEPLEQRQDHLSMYVDPRTCPASVLPWLAGWFDAPTASTWPEQRTRAVVAEAMDLNRWRGTTYGLARMIELCTGAQPDIRPSDDNPAVLCIHLPASVDRRLVEDLVQRHKPAHTGYTLAFDPT